MMAAAGGAPGWGVLDVTRPGRFGRAVSRDLSRRRARPKKGESPSGGAEPPDSNDALRLMIGAV